MAYPVSRLLIDPHAPDREGFSIHRAGSFCAAVTFVTGGVNGKTARQTAEGNLADMSEYERGVLELRCCGELLATADGGLVRRAA